ncbi:MAG: hypothetical protein WKF75_08420 [Singulisphaera sp.]
MTPKTYDAPTIMASSSRSLKGIYELDRDTQNLRRHDRQGAINGVHDEGRFWMAFQHLR